MRQNNFFKRQLCKVCCAALLLSTVAVTGGTQEAQAASKTEIETYGTTLTLNKTATGVLSEDDEQDWYIFNITERGYFTIDFRRNDSADTDKINEGWKCSLYSEDDLVNPISSENSITNKYEGGELPLPEGRYYICVEASEYYKNVDTEPVDCKYDIKINFTQTDSWEQEYNDTNAAPNSIEVNQTYYGNLYHDADVDWYQVTTPENGMVQMDFGPDVSADMNSIYNGWNVTILDEEMNIVREYTYQNKYMPQVLPFEKETFYIRIKAQTYYKNVDTEPVNCIYNLQLKFTSATDWETEYNNEYAKADDITSGNEYHGLLFLDSDEDWYKLENQKDSLATLQFRVDDSVSVDDIHNGWKIIVYNAEREVITEIEEIKKTIMKEEIRLPKGAAYIKVCADTYYRNVDTEPIDCIYHLMVTTVPVNSAANNTDTPPSAEDKPAVSDKETEKTITTGKVTTSTVTTKNKSVYLRWKKQKYANGYEIYRSTKKKSGYKKVKTINSGKKTSWTDKKVDGGKTYYYKIRAYRKNNGKKVTGGFSKVKKVKVK